MIFLTKFSFFSSEIIYGYEIKEWMKKITKYRSNGIGVVKFNIGNNNYDKTMIYYKSGKPKLERNYKNGELEGNLISYWENGTIHIRGKYKSSKRIGTWKTFDKKGNIVLSEDF